MKFLIVLIAVVSVTLAAPVEESKIKPAIPFDNSATANGLVIGKIQTANNVIGDVVTLGVNAQLGIDASVDQNIVNVILGLLNNQNGNDVNVKLPDADKLKAFVETLKSKLEKKD
jgi:hypothetical protein